MTSSDYNDISDLDWAVKGKCRKGSFFLRKAFKACLRSAVDVEKPSGGVMQLVRSESNVIKC